MIINLPHSFTSIFPGTIFAIKLSREEIAGQTLSYKVYDWKVLPPTGNRAENRKNTQPVNWRKATCSTFITRTIN